jgi:hypothetical protein
MVASELDACSLPADQSAGATRKARFTPGAKSLGAGLREACDPLDRARVSRDCAEPQRDLQAGSKLIFS